jgi:hypothetical protein
MRVRTRWFRKALRRTGFAGLRYVAVSAGGDNRASGEWAHNCFLFLWRAGARRNVCRGRRVTGVPTAAMRKDDVVAIRTWITLLTCALLASCSATKPSMVNANAECDYDKARLMALDEQHFDQDTSNGGGGWRAVAAKPGCKLAAADLLRDYRDAHGSQSGILYWHEAQLRALVGDYKHATLLMERSRKPMNADPAGWNPYVDATIAFLRKDRSALGEARSRLAVVQPMPDQGMPPVKDGFIELSMANGQTMKMRWPPNLEVVDGLIRCFDKPYSIAYGNDCRSPSH